METSLIGEMDMLREMGVRPNFSEMARRYGMDRHAAAKCWKEGAEMEDGRSARRSGFERYRDETGNRAQIPGVTMKAMHERLPGRHPDGKLPKYGASRHWMDARGLKASQPFFVTPRNERCRHERPADSSTAKYGAIGSIEPYCSRCRPHESVGDRVPAEAMQEFIDRSERALGTVRKTCWLRRDLRFRCPIY